uniref:Small ribosomal subunit protein uS8c n=1 Tax=Jenufa minuta TaxID=993092 RepID=A0A0S2LNN0_JENMI|nr:ribosomal protein S8 [Jenufa minuta]ALO62991.1 ribosomal protein S8 [Jenufa minuta]
MVNDSVSDMLTRIRNACLLKKSVVLIPYTRLNQKVAQILEKEGFIHTYQISQTQKFPFLKLRLKYILSNPASINQIKEKKSCITNLKKISKPGLRIYANHKKIPRILGGSGMIILSTPGGLMTDREARVRKTGGELLCSVW